jgi:nitrilase
VNTVRAAVVQDAPVAFDRERTLEKVRLLTANAAGDGARLVVFPEAFVSAYPQGVDFGARVGMRSSEDWEAFRRYWESAVDVPGPATQALAAAARDNGGDRGG